MRPFRMQEEPNKAGIGYNQSARPDIPQMKTAAPNLFLSPSFLPKNP
jgi:hypothetical protein